PDARPPPPAAGLGARPVRGARPRRRRHRRAVGAPRPRAHAGLRRPPGRLAGGRRRLGEPHPRAGGAAQRHPARTADAALRRSPHQRPDARPRTIFRPDARRHRRRWRGDRRGPSRRAADRPAFRARARRFAAGGARLARRRRARGDAGDRAPPARHRRRSRRGFGAGAGRGDPVARPRHRRGRRRLAVRPESVARRRTRRGGGAPAGAAARRGLRRRRRAPGLRRPRPAEDGGAGRRAEEPGALPRREAEEYVRALYRAERKALRDLGVRFGAYTIYVEDLVAPEGAWIREIFAALAAPHWRPVAGLAALPRESLPPQALTYRGLRRLAGVAAPIAALERIGDIARAAEAGFVLSPETLASLGWSAAEGERVLRGLGFIPAGKTLWRRRGSAARLAAPAAPQGPEAQQSEPCRIDVWLWRARFCKTLALAAKRVADGEVSGQRQGAAIALDKPSRQIRPGDVLNLAFGERRATLQVQGVGEK